MKLKELLSKIYAGDERTEISIVIKNSAVVEDMEIRNLPFEKYESLKNREVESITAPDIELIHIILEPDQ